MKVDFKSDFPVTDAACKTATGRTLKDWFTALEARGETLSRRDSINWMNGEMKAKDFWWSTTVWVEFERGRGIVNKKDGLIEGYNICVTKTINAGLKDVYSAFVKPTELVKWFGAGTTATVKDGGQFKDQDGNYGEFLRVRTDKDLRFTWKGQKSDSTTQVDIAFADKGKGKSGITLTHNRIQTRAEADGLRTAWGAAFDRLKAQLE